MKQKMVTLTLHMPHGTIKFYIIIHSHTKLLNPNDFNTCAPSRRFFFVVAIDIFHHLNSIVAVYKQIPNTAHVYVKCYISSSRFKRKIHVN